MTLSQRVVEGGRERDRDTQSLAWIPQGREGGEGGSKSLKRRRSCAGSTNENQRRCSRLALASAAWPLRPVIHYPALLLG
jgi:hypothetical protein